MGITAVLGRAFLLICVLLSFVNAFPVAFHGSCAKRCCHNQNLSLAHGSSYFSIAMRFSSIGVTEKHR